MIYLRMNVQVDIVEGVNTIKTENVRQKMFDIFIYRPLYKLILH